MTKIQNVIEEREREQIERFYLFLEKEGLRPSCGVWIPKRRNK